MDNNLDENTENSKVSRLVEYLSRLASLRTKTIRDVSDYQNVLWVKDIPKTKGCFTQAWEEDNDFDADVWIEIQAQREPQLCPPPTSCKSWVDPSLSLRIQTDLPKLRTQIAQQVRNPSWHAEAAPQEYINHTKHLKDHPAVQSDWKRYVKESWLPWRKAHDHWESVQKVYAYLFAIHQEQLRLGEEYELVLALGLLTWKTPADQRVRRHLIVANAVLEFEADLEKFIVRPLPDGANIRSEFDMLDIEDQSGHAEETTKTALAHTGDSPWEKDSIEEVLQTIVHSIDALGKYDGTLEPMRTHASDKPIVELAPALLLRKRSSRGLTEVLNRIKEKIKDGDHVPSEFKDLAEMRSPTNIDLENNPGEENKQSDGEVFFPKPSNDEQRRILDLMKVSTGVLVQGPPGTGKSHTIANLVCHLLASGQRTLITAKTPRALQVLKGLVPDELRPLCVNLLGNGLEEKQSLESSVGGILRTNGEWNQNRTTREREELELELSNLQEERTTIDRQLREIRESETHSQSIAEGTYQGTATHIAKAVNHDRNTYGWFADEASLQDTCPISEENLRSVLLALRKFTPEKRHDLSLLWPEVLASPEQMTALIERERTIIDEEQGLIMKADGDTADDMVKADVGAIRAIHHALSEFQTQHRRSAASPHPWMHTALRDIKGGSSLSFWRELAHTTREVIGSIEPLVTIADNNDTTLPVDANIRALRNDVFRFKEYLQNGGKLGWGPFRTRLVKELLHIPKDTKVNGHLCSSLERLSILADILCVQVECEKAWKFWEGWCEKTSGPYALQLSAIKAQCEALEQVLALEEIIADCRKTLEHCPSLAEPSWADERQIALVIASCELALARHSKNIVAEELRRMKAPLEELATGKETHSITVKLLQALHNSDVDKFAHLQRELLDLKNERMALHQLDEDIDALRHTAPRLTEALISTCNETCWDKRTHHIADAWHWAQAKFWIEEYLQNDDPESLSTRRKQIEDQINTTTERQASLHAWTFCFSRLNEEHRRHMVAWQQSMQRLGKGTGKHAPGHRHDAQRHLNKCREAVPAWVMPLHRVWDTVDPAPEMFDVVIVDEASQCGLEALPLFYLAKKMLIVGDDKQISPDAVGIDQDIVNRLKNELLYDFRFKSSFDIQNSLFDHGKLRYGKQQVTLREHFRCMPEIIRFSNNLCYSSTPLIPLRQYGRTRLTPLEHVFVSDGYREGTDNRVVNQPEAIAIVEKISTLCRDARYSGKTMGVVVLQGTAQAHLIEKHLLEQIGPEEMERRNLVCGNPYSFQGGERDIMFLSMVAATNERIGSLTTPAAERRFNVAASRARDQMFLFHSVSAENLSTSCLRHQLLAFFKDTKPQKNVEINSEELERRACQDNRGVISPPSPFESWFEIDVALELVRKGFFNIVPQYEVADRRIDLVVDGGKARLAVECEGDEWHGPDRYNTDMQCQRQLERCGWEFFRIRESAFYIDEGFLLDLVLN